MGERDRVRARRVATVVSLALALTVVAFVPSGTASAASYGSLSVFTGNHLLGNLSGPTISAGSSGTLSYTLQDLLSYPMSSIALTLDVYAQGSGAGPASTSIGSGVSPILTGPNGLSGANITFPLPSLARGQVLSASVPVATSQVSDPTSFFVRTALAFVANGTPYLLESRGWFGAALWSQATELPNGSATLNLSRLGVSGVTPETSILVQTTAFDWAIAALIGVMAVLVGLGAFFYFRRTRSSSGANRPPGARSAPSALGKRRKSDGD